MPIVSRHKEHQLRRMSKLPALTDAEIDVMEVIWVAGELSATEVRKHLPKKLARQTVQTVMTRLVDKGWLTHRSIGRTFVYRATVRKDESLGQKVRELVDTAFGGSADELLLNLIQHRGLSKAEAARISKYIDDAETR